MCQIYLRYLIAIYFDFCNSCAKFYLKSSSQFVNTQYLIVLLTITFVHSLTLTLHICC